IELNSLSKSANMAGWRIGMLVANPTRINDILRFKSNMDSGMFLPTQMAAAKALSLGPDWYQRLNETYRERRKYVYAILDTLGCSYWLVQVGMFVWARVLERYASGYALSDEVFDEARVFITPGGIFGDASNAYVRISLCASIERFVEAISRIKRRK